MLNHYLRSIFVMLVLSSSLPAQQNVIGKLISKDTFDLSVIRVYPDSFPKISIVFKAEDRHGIPLWDLQQKNVSVKEDSNDCKIISLEKISKQRTVMLELVVDHSGSMHDDQYQLYDTSGQPKYVGPKGEIYPPDYQSPLTVAKKAVNRLISEMDLSKDSIGFIGFSEKSDLVQSPTNDIRTLKNKIDAMTEDGGTAFYDAVSLAMDKIKKSPAIKAVIALTDGEDNLSKMNKRSLVRQAKKLKIPVYIIGLGNVVKNDLSSLAKQLGGEFYYTRSAGSLSAIYKKITQKIMAVYELKYESPNLLSKDTVRETRIDFDIENIFLSNNILHIDLPKEVQRYLKEKERTNVQRTDDVTQTIKQIDNDPLNSTLPVAGMLALACAAAAGSVLLYKRWRGPSLKKTSIGLPYPNPSAGEIKLPYDLNGGSATVRVMDMNGRSVMNLKTITDAGELQLDLGNCGTGNYFLKVTDANGLAEVRRVIIVK